MIAFSLCGGLENNGPTEEEFENHVIEYSDVCRDPSIFMSPQLVVRLCNKFYSWAAASSIVMTTIAYRKPLTSVCSLLPSHFMPAKYKFKFYEKFIPNHRRPLIN